MSNISSFNLIEIKERNIILNINNRLINIYGYYFLLVNNELKRYNQNQSICEVAKFYIENRRSFVIFKSIGDNVLRRISFDPTVLINYDNSTNIIISDGSIERMLIDSKNYSNKTQTLFHINGENLYHINNSGMAGEFYKSILNELNIIKNKNV